MGLYKQIYWCLLQNKINKFNIRLCSSLVKNNTLEQLDSQWIPVYKFPFISIVSNVSRVKFYQAGITGIGIPILAALEKSSIIPENVLDVFSAIGITGTITLFLFAKVSTNVVGFLYTNHESDQIKISYLDFWGKRKEIKTDLEKITTKNYKHISNIKVSTLNFKLFPSIAEIYDFQSFDKIIERKI